MYVYGVKEILRLHRLPAEFADSVVPSAQEMAAQLGRDPSKSAWASWVENQVDGRIEALIWP